MRLVCPNCDAEYEVDDNAIPQIGRDVQCSNCGHAWFQLHPDVEAEREAEAALYEPPVAVVPAAAVMADASVELPVGEEDEPDVAAAEILAIPPAPRPDDMEPAAPLTPEQAVAAMITDSGHKAPVPPPAVPSRSLDASVLAVLREEAEREAAARKTDAPPAMETQVEMGLDSSEAAGGDGGSTAAALRRIARMKGEPEPQPEPVARSRREMLPAIDEINSSLRATGARRSDDDNVILEDTDSRKSRRSGFGRGFMLVVFLALIVVALYLAAPMISARFPAAKDAMDSYVGVVDSARGWVDAQVQTLIRTLRGFEGGQAG